MKLSTIKDIASKKRESKLFSNSKKNEKKDDKISDLKEKYGKYTEKKKNLFG